MNIPEHLLSGVQYIESLSAEQVDVWLRNELFGQSYWLSGTLDEQPVGTIVKHYAHLTEEAQSRIREAIERFVPEFCERPVEWGTVSGGFLLRLASELPVPAVKRHLLEFFKSRPANVLRGSVLAAIIVLSNDDPRLRNVAKVPPRMLAYKLPYYGFNDVQTAISGGRDSL